MQVVRPYVDENKQVIFVEIEDEFLHDVVNGLLFGLVVFVPLGVLVA
jgi:hypothetical protein